MPRKESEAVPEGNGPTPQDAYEILGGTTLEEIRRIVLEVGKALKECTENLKRANQRVVSLEQDAR